MRKLSELNTVEFSKVLCVLSEPAERVFSDDKVIDAFEKLRVIKEESTNSVAFFARMMSALVPALFDSHIDDVCTIVATLKDVSVDDVRNQKGLDTLRDAWEMLTSDTELLTFFRPRKKG